MITIKTTNEFTFALEELRARCPELRFGQLILTIGMLAEDESGIPLWDLDDDDFAKAMERFSNDLTRRDSVT